MQENIKDPYHPGLLHTWFVTFGLWRADNKSELRMDAHHRHAAMISTRGSAGQATGAASQVTQVSSFKESMQLHDASFLDIVPEGWWQMEDQMPTAVMMTLFPSVSMNCFAWRCSRPMIWPWRLTVTVSNAISWYVIVPFPPDGRSSDVERHGRRA
jgi:phenylpropionate dioxygenase-like ring-hydroxylating dioxygenase large terminal subunit